MKTIDEIKIWLKENLDDERFLHSLGVADCAVELAEKYGQDTQKAYLAGLVHDCAKCCKNEELLDILQNKMHCDMEELLNPKTYHSPAGSYLAQKIFGIDDKEILDSIYCHTVGKEKMSVFEKIIFLADKIETRTREEVCAAPIRVLLFEENGLNKALLQCYKQTIKSLVDRNLTICPMTIDIYNSLQNKVK